MLTYLREVAGVPACRPPAVEGPVDRLLDSYGRYLRVERRLAPSTVRSHEDVARRFLSRHAVGDRLDLDDLTAAEVTAFVLAQARLRSVGSMKALLSPLRSLLRFLFVAGMRRATSPRRSRGSRTRDWRRCPRPWTRRRSRRCWAAATGARAVGRRDFAILTVLVRAGAARRRGGGAAARRHRLAGR